MSEFAIHEQTVCKQCKAYRKCLSVEKGYSARKAAESYIRWLAKNI